MATIQVRTDCDTVRQVTGHRRLGEIQLTHLCVTRSLHWEHKTGGWNVTHLNTGLRANLRTLNSKREAFEMADELERAGGLIWGLVKDAKRDLHHLKILGELISPILRRWAANSPYIWRD